jgi:hypothetical protein
MAMQNAGKLQEGDEPSSEQLANNLNRLSDMIALWQTQGIKLWCNKDVSVTLSANQTKYAQGDLGLVRYLRVLQGYYQDANGIKRPLQSLSWDEYTRLSTNVQTGQVNSYFVDKQATQLSVSMWLTPDAQAATGTVHLIVQRQITSTTGLLTSLDFAVEWFIALQWGLAAEICTGMPDAIVQRCETKALTYRLQLENWDVEDASTQFTPDQRSAYATGGFR